MDAADLKELWENNSHRPAVIREHRDAFNEHTDTSEPVPDGSLFDVRQWIDRFDSVVTRQLKEATGETPTDTDSEG